MIERIDKLFLCHSWNTCDACIIVINLLVYNKHYEDVRYIIFHTNKRNKQACGPSTQEVQAGVQSQL